MGGAFSGTRNPPVPVEGSPCMVPAAAQAYVLNATVVPDGALGYLTLWPDIPPPPPIASTLNALDGVITNNMAIVPTTNGEINATASGTTQLILDISSYFAPTSPLSITTTSLPGGTISVPYSSTLMASGGEPPYSWTIVSGSGSLPPGLGLSSNGVISGTPTAVGMYNFTVQVTDIFSNMASAPLSITIQTGPLVITTTQLPSGTVLVPYSATLGASGGTPPYTWSETGALPAGLSLNPSTGVISGTPPMGTTGTSNFTVTVKDSSSPPVTAMAPVSITINAQISNASLTGNYALSFNGYNSGSPVFIAGSFYSDGMGNISNGTLDINCATGGYVKATMVTGIYLLQNNGLGTMTITLPQPPPPPCNLPTNNLVFSVTVSTRAVTSDSRNGTLILNDPMNPGSYGSGVIKVQNTAYFSLPFLAGNYALGYFGIDPSLNRVAGAAAYQMDNMGNLTNGVMDVDDNGVVTSPTFAGTFNTVDPMTGRGTATLMINGSTFNYAFYVVTSQQIIMVSTDPIGGTPPANLTLWSISRQETTPSGFNNTFLNGLSVLEVNGSDVMGGSETEAGLLTTFGDGSGSFSIDQNDNGTLTQLHGSGTYSVATNGRVTLSPGFGANPPVLYLIGQNAAYVVGTDSLVTTGILDAQFGGPPFTNSSIIGTYLGGTLTSTLSSVTNSATYAAADGNPNLGNMDLTEFTSGPGGSVMSMPMDTYTVDGTGRGVLMMSGSQVGILYVVTPQKFVLLPVGANPVLGTFTLASTN
ncbi:MAG: Ig domain-containing protein, partial [Candidatus Korobacteraceae bacterium]